MAKPKLKYKRVLLKLTGELFGKKGGKGISFAASENIASELIRIQKKTGVELAIVVGGGNIFRGRERDSKVDEATADYMGMLATVLNGLALQEALERLGAQTRMLTAFEIKSVAEPYIRRRAIKHLEKGRIVILAAGVGSPFFTTDTGAALRSIELNCNVLLKATNVDGVYPEDPKKNPRAKRYSKISYREALDNKLKIMDTAAFALCKDHKLPIVVFNISNLKSLDKILRGEAFGTLITS